MSERRARDLEISEERRIAHIKVAEVVAARVRNPRTGSDGHFYRLDFPDWVNVVAVNESGELVLIRQFRFGSREMELEIPGGAVERGESPLAAGERELLEETGFAGKRSRIIGEVNPNPAIQGNRCTTILVEGARRVASPRQDDMEDIETLLLSRAAVEEHIDAGRIRHGLVLNALMFYERWER